MNQRSKHLIEQRREWMEINGSPDADFEDAYEDMADDCGKMMDGGCMYAGTEYCDWDCPFSSIDIDEEE